MRRFRLSTLMLLVVIAALAIGLVVLQQRAARRAVQREAKIAELENDVEVLKAVEARSRILMHRQANRRPTAVGQEQVDEGTAKAKGEQQ